MTHHACERVVQYIKKIRTNNQAQKYIKSKFTKLCKSKDFNGYPIAVFDSGPDVKSITSKGHTFTFAMKPNNRFHIITYHYWIAGELQGQIKKKCYDKEKVYKNIALEQDKKFI